MKLSPSAAFLAGYGASAARFVADTPPPQKRGTTPQSTGVLGRGAVDSTLETFGVTGAPPDSAGPAPWADHLERVIASAGEDAFVRLGRGAGLAWAAGYYKASDDELRAKSAETQARQLLGGVQSGSAAQAAQTLVAALANLAAPMGGNLLVATIRDLLTGPTFLARLDGGSAAPRPAGDAAAALERVLANPDVPGLPVAKDDEARLAYAQAIAGTDAVRAGFIQLQIQAAPMTRFDALPIRGKANDLLKSHAARWTPKGLGTVVYRRGFAARVTLDAATFLARAAEIYRLAPITELLLTGVKPVLRDLLASPSLKRIRVLSLSKQKLDDGDLALLAASPNLDNLIFLDISLNPIGYDGLDKLVRSPGLPRLEVVSTIGIKDDPATRTSYDVEGGRVDDEIPTIQSSLGNRFAWTQLVGGPDEDRIYW